MSKMDYDRNRTDNIELLFKAIYYAELVENTNTETKSLRKKLMLEFKQFPVIFDKDKRASRYAAPYRYSENGIVSISTAENNHYILLEPWEPKNRPQSKKTERKAQPNYNALLEVNPIWFLQVMLHKGRKTVRHRKNHYSEITNYRNDYKEFQILKGLPVEETADILTSDRDMHMSFTFNSTLRNFQMRLYAFRDSLNKSEHLVDFFFLNEDEIERLAKAVELDNPKRGFVRHYANKHTGQALNQIIENPPKDRVVISVNERRNQMREIPGPKHYNGPFQITDHDAIWRQLHHQYAALSDNQLEALRGFDLLDDELLAEVKKEQNEQAVTT